MRALHRHPRWLLTAAATLIAAFSLLVAYAVTTHATADAGSNLSQLNNQLGANEATQSNLSADVTALDAQISKLNNQISLVRSREDSVKAQLATDRSKLAGTKTRLNAEKRHLAKVRAELKRAQTALSDQLVSSYEQPQTTLMTIVINSGGFRDMLTKLQYLKTAENSQQKLITITTRAKAAATAAAKHLSTLKQQQTQATTAATTQANALAGMNDLLSSRQASLSDIESARATALADARAKGSRLRSAINTIKAQQAAAARAAAAAEAKAAAAAAAAAASASSSSGSSSGSVSSTPSGGWAIPAAVVMCESGGQNLPPNSAGASGYYQIMPATWAGEGGTGPAAYLAPKSEQDAIAAKLWNGGAGASNWVCAGIVGID